MELTFTKFDDFLEVIKNITQKELIEVKKLLLGKGKEIKSLDNIFINSNDEFFDFLPDGSLVRVNLYIAVKNVEVYRELAPENLYKYHIYKCKTIDEMFKSGRKFRYSINNRIDGTFYYKFADYRGNILKEVENQKLNICKYCLSKYLNRRVNDIDVENFNLAEFHKNNSVFFNNLDIEKLEKGEFVTPNIYVDNWNYISRKVREKRKYTCENCGFSPRNEYEKRFIHTHHINGDKINNYEDNLKVLCIKCHSEVDNFHLRIKNSKEYKEFLNLI